MSDPVKSAILLKQDLKKTQRAARKALRWRVILSGTLQMLLLIC